MKKLARIRVPQYRSVRGKQKSVIRKIANMGYLLCSLILVYCSLFPAVAVAYLPLKQTDWSGGYGQQVWSDSTKFKEHYHVDYLTKGELKIPGNDTWLDPQWKYRQKINIDNTDSGELDHFPLLVVLEHKVNFNYNKAHSSGLDLRFTDSDGTTIIPYDIEHWNRIGKSYVWVKIPTINQFTNQDYFYMYYGNPEAIDARSPRDVWDNKFVAVYHLNEVAGDLNRYADTTREGNDGTLHDTNRLSTQTAGQMAYAHQFDGDDYIQAPDSNSLDVTNTMTMSTWVKVDRARLAELVAKEYSGSNTAYLLRQAADGKFSCQLYNGTTFATVKSNFLIEANRMYHFVCTYDGNTVRMYIDGKFENSTATSIGNIVTSTNPLVMGRNPGTTTAFFEGTLDEVRLSNATRSPDWIRAEHMSETNTFLAFGNEELLGSELLSSVFDAGHGTSWGYLSYIATEPINTAAKVKVRSGNDRYLADAPDFETCDSITNKTDISSNKCVVDSHRYIQYQVILESTQINKTPIFKDISVTDYLPTQTKPVVLGVSSVTPSPSPPRSEILHLPSPVPAPRNEVEIQSPSRDKPSPSPTNSVTNFLNALFN